MSAPLPPAQQSHADEGDQQDSRKRKAESSAAGEAHTEGSSSAVAAKQPRLDAGDSVAHASAAASSQVAVVEMQAPHHSSAMLRCLSSCRDAQFALMQMLELQDLAQLDATCRTWRVWLANPPLLAGLSHTVCADGSRLLAALQSPWLPQLLTSFQQMCQHSRSAIAQQPRQEASLMLRSLPQCTRLRHLQLHIHGVAAADLGACFVRLAGSLRSLHVDTSIANMLLLRSFFRTLLSLRSLETLQVIHTRDIPTVDLSALPLMRRLSTLTLSCGRYDDDDWRCTPAQVQCLVRCRALTSLTCGRWSPDPSWPNVEQQIADGIGALVSGWLDAPSVAASSSSASAVSASVSTSPVASLTHLNLHSTPMTPAVWAHVSRLTTLEELKPRRWSADMTRADWQKLAGFSHMRLFVAAPVSFSTWLESDHIVPPLLSCVQLSRLELSKIRLSRQQLQSMCTALPLLSHVALAFVQLEDCSPLSLAPSLQSLSLAWCSGLEEAPMQFRCSLPPMQHLTELSMYEVDARRLTAEQAAPLNAALLARMPMLTLENITQSFAAGDENHDDEEDEDDDEAADEGMDDNGGQEVEQEHQQNDDDANGGVNQE